MDRHSRGGGCRRGAGEGRWSVCQGTAALLALPVVVVVVVRRVIDGSAFFLGAGRPHWERAGPGGLDWLCCERVDVCKVRAQRQRREWVGEQRSWRPQRSELREAPGPAPSFGPSSLGRFQAEEPASSGVLEKSWPLNWYVARCPSLRLSSLVTQLV